MIKALIYLKNGQQLSYDEINKIFIEDDLMLLSTFRGQYICLNINEIVGFEVKYPQTKSSKAYAMFKQLTSQFNQGNLIGKLDE